MTNDELKADFWGLIKLCQERHDLIHGGTLEGEDLDQAVDDLQAYREWLWIYHPYLSEDYIDQDADKESPYPYKLLPEDVAAENVARRVARTARRAAAGRVPKVSD